MLFTNLAMAINDNRLNPAKVNDAFIAQGADSVIETCRKAGSVPGESDLKSFRTHMAGWSEHLASKLAIVRDAAGAD
jgi:hypothetical protein